MELWLDTIDLPSISYVKDLGLLHGVTTNPSILSHSDKAAEVVLEKMQNVFSGPIAVQVTLRKTHEMIEQAKDLIDFSQKIVVKIPATPEGIEAIARLSHLGITTMATAILEPLQGYFAAKAGANYLAPYFSHIGERALDTCLSLQQMCTVQGLTCKLIIASLRSAEQVAACIESGFAAITIPPNLFRECIKTPHDVVKHLDRFEADWKKAPFSNLLAPRQLIS